MTYVNMWLLQQLYLIFSALNFLSRVPDSQTVVSDLLDAYGYAIFFSPFIAALPGFIFKAISFFTKSRVKGDFYGYLSIQTVVVILSSEWHRNNVIIYLIKYSEIIHDYYQNYAIKDIFISNVSPGRRPQWYF